MLRELPLLVTVALVLAFLLRTFVVQVFFIPSESMEPTLLPDDRIVVEKVSYRFTDVSRGDVVVFADDGPIDGSGGALRRAVRAVGAFFGFVPADGRDVVKRIIGLPGDRVVIEAGNVSVNGVALREPYARLDTRSGSWDVAPGALFVLGDHRARSGDSRSALGLVDRDHVIGRVVLRIWPLDRVGSIAATTFVAGDGPSGIALRREAARRASPLRKALASRW